MGQYPNKSRNLPRAERFPGVLKAAGKIKPQNGPSVSLGRKALILAGGKSSQRETAGGLGLRLGEINFFEAKKRLEDHPKVGYN